MGSSLELAGGHLLRNHERQILANRRIRDDVLVDDQVGDTIDEFVDIELEGAPLSGQLRIPDRRDPALAGSRAAPRNRQLIRRCEARRDPERLVQPLDRSLDEEEPALGDAADVPTFLREWPARREVDMGLLEERDLVVARIDVSTRGREQTFGERRAQSRLLVRERLLQLHASRR